MIKNRNDHANDESELSVVIESLAMDRLRVDVNRELTQYPGSIYISKDGDGNLKEWYGGYDMGEEYEDEDVDDDDERTDTTSAIDILNNFMLGLDQFDPFVMELAIALFAIPGVDYRCAELKGGIVVERHKMYVAVGRAFNKRLVGRRIIKVLRHLFGAEQSRIYTSWYDSTNTPDVLVYSTETKRRRTDPDDPCSS